MDLNVTWFLLVAVLLGGYAILDGFDLGVGVLHLFARGDRERRIQLNAIGPVWDGNEVWLLTGGGALFAAFPIVYATVFSGFYMALVLLLVALIFRAVALEFRSKVDSPAWRSAWDRAFTVGSLVPALLLGVAFGNILRGIPIDARGVFTGSFLGLLNPYALLLGILSLAVFTMHGAIYLAMKTEGEHRTRVVRWITPTWVIVVVLYAAATLGTVFVSPFLFEGMMRNPLTWVLFVVLLGGLILVPVMVKGERFGRAFVGSAAAIAGMFGLCAVSLFPKIVPSSTDPAHSLTIYNAASSQTTLTTMLVIALIGMPFVIGYTIVIYRTFRGPVVLTRDSY